MIIDCISDLHGFYPNLIGGGDLLIIAGDLTARDEPIQYDRFSRWLDKQSYKFVIIVPGNHDNLLQRFPCRILHTKTRERNQGRLYSCDAYLCDSGCEFEGLKIWGSPWTKTFPGINPKCKAFTCETEEELAEKWKLIPEDIDILITHGPSQGVLDEVKRGTNIENVGSASLIKPMIKSGCRLHVFGHIHEGYGKFYNPMLGITYINCSHVNEHYEPVNKPVRIEL